MREGWQQDSVGESPSWLQRAGFVLAWIWPVGVAFCSLLAGMAADGCSGPECESRITRTWLDLLAFQLAALVAGVAATRKASRKLRILFLGGLPVLATAPVVR